MGRQAWIYIVTNLDRTVFYTGVTTNLQRRIGEHQNDASPTGFTARYRLHLLVFIERHERILDALAREKQIKSWSRRRKLDLISKTNPEFRDLSGELNS